MTGSQAYKDRFRLRCFITIVPFLCLLIPGCSPAKSPDVEVIWKTNTYHTESCPKVNMARTVSMPLTEAKREHIRPCPYCKPDSALAGRAQ